MSEPEPESLRPDELAALAALAPAELGAHLEAWVQEGVSALPRLEALESAARDPAARKLVRRALHRLRAAGIRVEPPASPRRASVLRAVDDDEQAALVSAPDAEGFQQMFAIVLQRSEACAVELAVHADRGVQALRALTLGRAEARDAFRNVERSIPALRDRSPDGGRPSDGRRPQDGDAEPPGLELARVPAAQAFALIARAQRRTAELPADVSRAALELLLRRAGAQTPGEAVREKLGGGEPLSGADAEATLAARLRADRAPPWRVGDADTWAGLTRELEGFQHSRIILSAAQQEARRESVMRAAWQRIFDAEGRVRLAERLEESAAIWSRRGDEAAARAAVQVAARVRNEPDVARVAFARECFEASLRSVVATAQDEQRGRLVVPG